MGASLKIFILAGEASGDRLGAWYLEKRRAETPHTTHCAVTAVGGDYLRSAGAEILYESSELSVVGITEIISALPRLYRVGKAIVKHIVTGQYDEVILVDFPGFNFKILRALRKKAPTIKITYLSPPQLWVWGAWRVKTLKQCRPELLVIYPFEVDWYAQRGLTARFIGNPVADQYASSDSLQEVSLEEGAEILLLPGSRKQEIKLARFYVPALERVAQKQGSLTVSVLIAPSLSKDLVAQQLEQYQTDSYSLRSRITWNYCVGEHEHSMAKKRAVCALTKPGTNTLELALQGIPAVVIYKASWLTYQIARRLVTVTSMTLPNLLTGRSIYPELIQNDCTVDAIARELNEILHLWSSDRSAYQKKSRECASVRDFLLLK